MKPKPALIRQGAAVHWWLDAFVRTACRSWVGACTDDKANVTCADCLEGRVCEDPITGPYGKPYERTNPERKKGQLTL